MKKRNLGLVLDICDPTSFKPSVRMVTSKLKALMPCFHDPDLNSRSQWCRVVNILVLINCIIEMTAEGTCRYGECSLVGHFGFLSRKVLNWYQ